MDKEAEALRQYQQVGGDVPRQTLADWTTDTCRLDRRWSPGRETLPLSHSFPFAALPPHDHATGSEPELDYDPPSPGGHPVTEPAPSRDAHPGSHAPPTCGLWLRP